MIFRDLGSRAPFWHERNGSRYLVDPWRESAEVAGMRATGEARRQREAEQDEARRRGTSPPPDLTDAELTIIRRRAEAAEYIIGWEGETWNDTNEPAECTHENRLKCLASNFGMTSDIWLAAYLRRSVWEQEKKGSASSLNGTGTAREAADPKDGSGAETATVTSTSAPPRTEIPANT